MKNAQVGDLIIIVNAWEGYPYTNGSILEVVELPDPDGDVIVAVGGHPAGVVVEYDEYEIYRKAGEEDAAPVNDCDVCNSPLGEISCSSAEGGSLCSAKCADEYELKVISAREIASQEKYKSRLDAINPQHYKQGRVEVIDIIEDAVQGADPFEAVLQANIIKYTQRYRTKNGVEDLKKAQWYLDKLVNHLSDQK